jgi:L-alanine-DL-glutamate epimerase-like enolase superfamily enzyme
MLEAGAVDVLQADATRCAGVTGFVKVGALCESSGVPLSSHTAPSLHLPACAALGAVRHAEYFYDHARIEQLLFDGAAVPRDGVIASDLSRPGLGLELRRADAARYIATF